MKKYYQCRLRLQNTYTLTTGWIEARAAKLGARVELLPSKDLWTVAEVFDLGIPEGMLKEQQRLHRNSLPSVEGIHR